MSRKRNRRKNKSGKTFGNITLNPQALLNRDAKRWRYFITMMEKSEPGTGKNFIRIVDKGIAAEESLKEQVKYASSKRGNVYQK